MTAKQIARFFVLLNLINDFAYFGFLILQFLLLEPTLRALLPNSRESLSIGLTITLISSQLLFQILAEGPTGALADIHGRAWAVAMSFWCRLVAIVITIGCVLLNLHSDSQALALIAVSVAMILTQALMATGEAFLEGSIEAWLVDECKIADFGDHELVINKTFERSALAQNIAILFAVAAVLVVWQESGKGGGLLLAVLCGSLNLAGALISHRLRARERFANNGKSGERVTGKLFEALTIIAKPDQASVRCLISILVLPFPCWIVLSWFFTALAQSNGAENIVDSSSSFALLVGCTLGIARVIGASVGKWLGRRGQAENFSVFEKALFVNVSFLFGAAMLLALSPLVHRSVGSSVGISLFLSSIAMAKGSEEIVKLSKNKFLSSALPDDHVRATTLSFVSIAQNAFGFLAISLSGLLAFLITVNSARQPVVIFTVCASAGIAGCLIWLLTSIVSGRRPQNQHTL